MAAGIKTSDVKTAAVELAGMRRSLTAWLRFRAINDKVLTGVRPTRMPQAFAQRLIASRRDLDIEQDLANKLYALLGELMPGSQLPEPDVSKNPNAAVQLATIALAGASPMGMSGLGVGSPPWLWPVLIVGGLLLAVTTAIKTAADVAKDHEEKACIEAGACTDYGFYLKVGGVAMIAYLAWSKLGIGELVKGKLRKGR